MAFGGARWNISSPLQFLKKISQPRIIEFCTQFLEENNNE